MPCVVARAALPRSARWVGGRPRPRGVTRAGALPTVAAAAPATPRRRRWRAFEASSRLPPAARGRVFVHSSPVAAVGAAQLLDMDYPNRLRTAPSSLGTDATPPCRCLPTRRLWLRPWPRAALRLVAEAAPAGDCRGDRIGAAGGWLVPRASFPAAGCPPCRGPRLWRRSGVAWQRLPRGSLAVTPSLRPLPSARVSEAPP